MVAVLAGTMPKDTEDCDIQRLAQGLISRYADEAELVATGHADTMLDQSDMPAFAKWQKVIAMISLLHAKARRDASDPSSTG
jgi:hypothetical protein